MGGVNGKQPDKGKKQMGQKFGPTSEIELVRTDTRSVEFGRCRKILTITSDIRMWTPSKKRPSSPKEML